MTLILITFGYGLQLLWVCAKKWTIKGICRPRAEISEHGCFFLSQSGINCLHNNDLQLSQSICGSNKRDMMMMNNDNTLSHGSSPLDNLECITLLQHNPYPFLDDFYLLLSSFAIKSKNVHIYSLKHNSNNPELHYMLHLDLNKSYIDKWNWCTSVQCQIFSNLNKSTAMYVCNSKWEENFFQKYQQFSLHISFHVHNEQHFPLYCLIRNSDITVLFIYWHLQRYIHLLIT